MTHSFSRRARVRMISFAAAALAVAVGLAAVGWASAHRWRVRLENAQQRAWAELSEYTSDMEFTLNKLMYTRSLPEQTLLSAELLRDAGCAKAALSRLPMSGAPMDGAYRFLSQAGEYAQALTAARAAGQDPEGSADALLALYRYAAQLNAALADAKAQNADAAFTQEPLLAAANAPAVTDGFREAADALESYPTLVYDGPFSDRAEQAEPRMTAPLSDYGSEVALRTAQELLTLGELGDTALREGAAVGGALPCYTFSGGTRSFAVSRAGALLVRYTDARAVASATLSAEQGLRNACVFLTSVGYTGFEPTGYVQQGAVLTVQFAAEQDGVRCYPDQLKVQIALDTGAAVGLDAAGYVMNHTARTFAEPAVSADDAQQRLSPLLTVTAAPRRAVIPTSGGGEADCWEFSCAGVGGEPVLVYLDTATGAERNIQIVLQSESARLVM